MKIREGAPRAKRRCIAVAVAAALGLAPHAQAGDVVWVNTGTGNWNTAANWNTGAVPTASDTTIIANGGTATLPSLGWSGNLTIDGAGSTLLLTANTGVGMSIRDGGTLTLSNSGKVTVALVNATDAFSNGAALNVGAGGAPGVFDASLVQGTANNALPPGVVNFNHSDTNYFFTRDGTSGGAAILIRDNLAVNQIGTGTTVLTAANTYFGPTTVNAGTLVVNGSIVSDTTVNSGGTLGGSGTVGNVTVASGGALAPGNSIGTLTVNGNVNFAAGSIYRVEANAAGASDRTNASGTATLSGGTVAVQAASGTYQRNTTYTILNAAGGVTGTFSGVTSNFAFLTPSLAYDANNVFLTLAQTAAFNSVAQTRNQVAMSTYLDTVADSPGVSGLIAQIGGLSAEQARAAFASLSGDTLTAPATTALQGTGRFLGLIAGRIRTGGSGTGLAFSGLKLAQAPSTVNDASPDSSKEKKKGFWMLTQAARGGMKGDGNATGFDWRGGGASFGFDTEVQRDTMIGGAVSYGQSAVDFDSSAGSARVKSPRIALYGGHRMGLWEFKGAAGYADEDFDTRRNVVIGSSTTVASATHHGNEYSAYAEAQFSGYQVRPLVALRYINLKEKGYTESGSAANLTVDSRNTESIVSFLGARYVQGFNSGRGEFEARAVWGHEFGDVDPGVSGRLAAAPAGASFTVAGVPIERDSLTLGAGFANELRKNLFLHADASVEMRARGQNQQALTAALRYVW